jgi:predicted CopG family antitoxin
MPNPGYKSFTVSEEVYNYWEEKWKKQKESQSLRHGVTSFSGYLTQLLFEQQSLNEVIAKYAPQMDFIEAYEDRIALRDLRRDRIVEVFVRNKELYCSLCEEKECVHTGFAYAIPQVYAAFKNLGIERTPNRKER